MSAQSFGGPNLSAKKVKDVICFIFIYTLYNDVLNTFNFFGQGGTKLECTELRGDKI